MKTFNQKWLILFMSIAVLCTVSCNKETSSTPEVAAEEETLNDLSFEDARAEQLFNEIHEQELGMMEDLGMPEIGLNEVAVGNGIELDSVGSRCFVINIEPRDPGVFPKTVVVNYGPTDCVGRDGKKRRGKMITTYSAPMARPGATAVTRFENYSVNGVQVEGRHITKNNSTSTARIFTRTVEHGKLTFPQGGTTLWNASHTNTQIAGLGTPNFPLDDAFTITGGARGVMERNGNKIEWMRRIEEPLHKAFKCRWIDKGVVVITRNDQKAILNYGNGNCDNKAVILINGQRREITL